MRSPILACAALVLALAGPSMAQETPQTGAPAEWEMHMVELADLHVHPGRPPGGSYLRRRGGRICWRLQGWVGTDTSKFWGKVDSDGIVRGRDRGGRTPGALQPDDKPLLRSPGRSPSGRDARYRPARTSVVGVQGLTPYWFELDAAAFVSHTGDVTARLEAEYALLFSQRLVLQPRTEVNVAFQEIEALGIGSGLSSAEVGLRLRYEIRRELAPYVGVSWRQTVGGTADFARAAGDRSATTSFVAGLRLWY